MLGEIHFLAPIRTRRQTSRQADAERNAAATQTRRGVRRLSRRWARSKHRKECVGPSKQRDGSQPRRIHTLRTGNDDSVANLNIRDRNRWQSLKHVVDIEAATAGTTTRSTGTSSTLRSLLCITLSLCLTATRRSCSACSTGSRTKAAHSKLSRKSSQHRILLDNNRERSFLLQLTDLDLARRRIDLFDNAADGSKTSGDDLLRVETKRIFRAITKRA